MGGGGSFYDRDTTSTSRRTLAGFSDVAQKMMSKSSLDPVLLPKNRKLISLKKNPVVYGFDDTGSMAGLPKIICDKIPMMVGEIYRNKYLTDAEMSLATIGDVTSDRAPIQICDFTKLRSQDEWLVRLFLEKGGGEGAKESYEFLAYFYSRYCEMPNAENPFFLFTGDEGFRETIPANDLELHFGGSHQKVDSFEIFDELKKKFKNNVFLIHREYRSSDNNWIVRQWQKALGEERVIFLPQDLAIADITLGVFALASGSRTLEGYIEDIKSRPLDLGGVKFKPQSKERIDEVRNALENFATLKFPVKKLGPPSIVKEADKKDGSRAPGKKNKPGML